MSKLSRERAGILTAGFEGKRIVVLGDVMLDEFIWGRVRRISPEAPVPVVEVDRQSLALGGAGNVVSNLVALGASPTPIGVLGADPDAERLRQAFTGLEVRTDRFVIDSSRPTTVKTRIIAHSQQVVRADRESRVPISSEIGGRVIDNFRSEIESADAIVVSDYGKGLLTMELLGHTLAAARKQGLIVCLDPKMRSFAHYQPVTVITPNNQEAADASGIPIDDEHTLAEAGRRLLSSIDTRAVLITRGEEGMALFTSGGPDGAEVTHIPTVAREVYDVTGAGDTVIATLALALASGASLKEAAVLANHAAGVVVGKVGTASLTREELLATISA
ncbi:MAG: D-glycero-beta-D-manno-heptose-7-phosphate kinase [Acidobacteria bacterium]|nr:MAG: D-glycero-beta-D-manno-heptose-7-phosphate kinase [Acidobacteriota bacterium]